MFIEKAMYIVYISVYYIKSCIKYRSTSMFSEQFVKTSSVFYPRMKNSEYGKYNMLKMLTKEKILL